MVGRWKDGSSIVRYPYESRSVMRARAAALAAAQLTGKSAAVTLPAASTDESLVVRGAARSSDGSASVDAAPTASVRNSTIGDNDFLFGVEDPQGLRCPFGAHIRRSNPRDSLDPGSDEAIGIVNRHRILRVGRPYAPSAGANPGLLFMCLNGDIERQFELVQQDWLRSASFHGLANERDPLLGDGGATMSGFTIPTRDGPVVLDSLPSFVTVRGGGYFFLPGKRLLEYLARAR